MSSGGNTRKRKHHQRSSKSHRHYHANPSRGGPGILLTCETSREIKCEREGREILRFYLDKEMPTKPANDNDKSKSTQKLTLEQELAVLQQQKPMDAHGPFQLFDTGCAGTVFFMYAEEETKNDTKDTPEGTKSADENENKRMRTTTTADEEPAIDHAKEESSKACSSFDPVKMVKHIMSDIASDNTAASSAEAPPASRFVTRMIPVQVTCFATLAELEMVLFKLLASYKKKTTSPTSAKHPPETFRVSIKKRQCNQIKTLEFIETAATLVIQTMGWKVELTDPDHIIWIEVCKTLMGVSVLRRDDLTCAKNFNLAALRDQQRHSKEGDDKDDANES